MKSRNLFALFALLSLSFAVSAQQASQAELKIDPANRTLTVNAEDEVSVEPEVAVLQVGFETQTGDAQSVYADGKRISNAVIDALKQAGIPQDDIRSEMQRLDRDYQKPHKFKLVQQWTVKAPPERAAEILDVAVTAGATSSGDIEWTVKDERALQAKALDRAATRARDNAAVLAKSMGVRLGSLIYVSNQLGGGVRPVYAMAMKRGDMAAPQPLAVEPHKVSRTASVYAVYSIE